MIVNLFRRRIVKSAGYSLQGLLSTWKEEEAFRVEMLLALIFVPLGLYLGETRVEKVLLLGSIFVVLVVELLNSAVESVVDRVGSEQHDLSGRAKDQGSAAVLLSLLLVLVVWGLVLWP
ncbi:MAG: diacylglycerol kinase [Proteobacteria bacterium]|nr:diacylglycerol kinase [Pseudomonadota bacterium]MBU1456184.1 diacylglycerol kinase [Pseudomonadota bacterium]